MDVSIAPYQSSDLAGVLGVLAEAMPRDPVSEAKFVRQVLLDPNFRAAGAPVARVGDQVVGFCLSIARQVPLENSPPDADRGYITLFGVLPDFQRRGIGTRLLDAALNYLRAQGRKRVMIAPYAPGYFICGVDVAAYASGLAFFTRHGFAEVYRPIAMEIPLWDLVVPEWVRERQRKLAEDGVVVGPYRAELTLPILGFTAAEFAGDWVRVYRETMSRIAGFGESSSPIAVAYDGRAEQVVGVSHHDAERFGPIGVAASQRGRGIGQVLMYQTLAAQRLAGFRTAWFLWSDDKTATRLYTAAGFREVRRFALLKREIG